MFAAAMFAAAGAKHDWVLSLAAGGPPWGTTVVDPTGVRGVADTPRTLAGSPRRGPRGRGGSAWRGIGTLPSPLRPGTASAAPERPPLRQGRRAGRPGSASPP